jgi:hypothetical protein
VNFVYFLFGGKFGRRAKKRHETHSISIEHQSTNSAKGVDTSGFSTSTLLSACSSFFFSPNSVY